jgi:hypothetical protein
MANKGIRYGEGLHILPVTAPVAFTTSAVASAFVDLDVNHWCSFIVSFGVMTSDSTDTVTLTVEACAIGTTTDNGDTAMAFNYREYSAVGTDSAGDITAATATGASVDASADDAKVVLIDVDPVIAAKAVTGGRWVRVVATPSAQVAAGVISIVAVLESRYPANDSPSST